jgi:hypothetical protein
MLDGHEADLIGFVRAILLDRTAHPACNQP